MHQRNAESDQVPDGEPSVLLDTAHDVIFRATQEESVDVSREPDRFNQTLENISCLLGKLHDIDTLVNEKKAVAGRLHDGMTDGLIDDFVAQDAMDKAEFHRIELGQAKSYIRHLLEERERLSNRNNREESKRLRQALDEVAILSQKHAVAEAELQLCREELRNALKLNSSVRQRNIELSELNESLKADNTKFKGRLAVLRAENSKKQGQIQSVAQRQSEEIVTARRSARDRELECTHLSAKIRQLQDDLHLSRQSHEGMQSRFDVLRAELDASESQLADMRVVSERVELENAHLREQIRDLHGNVKSLNDHHQKLAVDKKAKESQGTALNALVTQLADARADTLSAKAEAKQFSSQLDNLKEKYVACVTRERALRTEVTELKSRESHESTTIASTTQTSQVETLKSVYMTKFKKMQKTINDLNEKIYELERRELTRAPVILSSRKSARDLKPLCIEIDEESEITSVRSLPPVQTTEVPITRCQRPMHGIVDCLDPEPIKVNLDSLFC